MKYFLYVAFYALTFCSNPIPHYKSITILEWIKDIDGKDTINLIEFDENGNILFNEIKEGSINIESLTEDFDKLIEESKAKKINASNSAPAQAKPPKNGQKRLYITFVEIKDFDAEKEFFNKSSTVYTEIIPIQDDYNFYKILNENNLEIIKQLLKSQK